MKIKKSSYVLSNSGTTIIFHSSKNKQKLHFLNSLGVKTYFVKKNKDNFLNFLDILKNIYQLDITSVLVEAGPIFLKHILKLDIINEFYLFKSDIKIPKTKEIDISHIVKQLEESYKFSKKINTYLDKDSLLHYY